MFQLMTRENIMCQCWNVMCCYQRSPTHEGAVDWERLFVPELMWLLPTTHCLSLYTRWNKVKGDLLPSGILRSVPTFRDKLLFSFSRTKQSKKTLEPWKWDREVVPKMSVTHYHFVLRKFQEERRSHLYRGGSLKSRKAKCCPVPSKRSVWIT